MRICGSKKEEITQRWGKLNNVGFIIFTPRHTLLLARSMKWTRLGHARGKREMCMKVWSEKLNGIYQLRDMEVNGKLTLK
jgi:hypothetical protein